MLCWDCGNGDIDYSSNVHGVHELQSIALVYRQQCINPPYRRPQGSGCVVLRDPGTGLPPPAQLSLHLQQPAIILSMRYQWPLRGDRHESRRRRDDLTQSPLLHADGRQEPRGKREIGRSVLLDGQPAGPCGIPSDIDLLHQRGPDPLLLSMINHVIIVVCFTPAILRACATDKDASSNRVHSNLPS